jgi:hypothetical protein
MFKTKLSTILALVAVLSLLLTPAAYAAEGATSGSFGAASQAPTVSLIQIYNEVGCTTFAASMTPQVPYWCKVTVNSANKLKHLNEVKVTLFYNSTGSGSMVAPGTADTQTCAILTCTIGLPPTYTISWTIAPSSSTTWVLGTSTAPANLDLTTGDWIFAFTPGKVAHVANGTPAVWDAQGLATNRNSQTGEKYVRGKYMDCFGQITVNTANVNWGEVPLGLTRETNAGNGNPQIGISVNYISNGNYYQDIKSTDWTGATDNVTLDITGGNPPSSAGQFALKANDISDNTTSVIVTKAYSAINDTSTITFEAGNTVTTNTLWLSLSESGILPGTYSGAIYYEIRCR